MSRPLPPLWRDRAPVGTTSRGQSLVELALVLPVLLLLMLVAIDFGRIYLGYVNLQQMARVAAGFAAEHATAWQTTFPNETTDRWRDLIDNDAAMINCTPHAIADPAFNDGFDLGDPVQVRISCSFRVITPVISTILGDDLLVSAEVVYPIREGAVAEVPGGGGPVTIAPDADFYGSPLSGYEPLVVTFTDTSQNTPTSWLWNFGNGNSDDRAPAPITYECGDSVPAGDSCTFSVSLMVGNTGGFDTTSRSDYVTVWVPPETGPIAEFEGSPVSGLEPLDVDFEFVDIRSDQGTPVVYTAFEWDFGDGSPAESGPALTSVSHRYDDEGPYSVTLKVTDDAGNTDTLTKADFVIVARKVCVVPDFAGVRKNSAQDRWSAAGFTTDVQFLTGNGNYLISNQSLLGGLPDPQPDGCDSMITVGP